MRPVRAPAAVLASVVVLALAGCGDAAYHPVAASSAPAGTPVTAPARAPSATAGPSRRPSPRPTVTPATVRSRGLTYRVCRSTSADGCPSPYDTTVTVRMTARPSPVRAGEWTTVRVTASSPAADVEPEYGCPVVQGVPGEPVCAGGSSSCEVTVVAGGEPPPVPHRRSYAIRVRIDVPGAYVLTSRWLTRCPSPYSGHGTGSLRLEVV